MISIGSACLLLLAGFSRHAFAAQQLRTPADPYLVSPPGLRPDGSIAEPLRDGGELDFSLKHIYHHGSHHYPHLHRYLDIPDTAQLAVQDEERLLEAPLSRSLRARGMSMNIERMVDRRRSTIDSLLDHAQMSGQAMSLPASGWTVDQITGPDTSNKSTVISLAWMAANAYTEVPYTGDWQDVGGGFNNTDDIGWEEDGIRGHVFATEDNSTIVIGLKGTSMAIFDGKETTGNDKLNDNLFGSCCCGQGGDWGWKHACDCMTSQWNCNSTCLVKELRRKSNYYLAAQDLYHNVTERYPNSDVWLAGHSLGGVVGILLGLTYGLPVVSFETYPDAMAASRLGLPVPPGYRIGRHQSRTDVAIHHFGHTADPIFVGQCHGYSSPCSVAGYAFEGVCHTGKTCTYDTVNDKNWGMGVGYHKILGVIRDVLMQYDTVANCTEFLDCTDCYKWKFFESNGSETTTSRTSTSTSTYTRTRTETCKTPGWWGCLDETTTTSHTTSPSTSTSSTSSSCETPGWFGCKDPTTATSSRTKSASPAPTITTITTTTTKYPTKHPSSSKTCTSPGYFGGCNDPTTTASSSARPSPPISQSIPSMTSSATECASKRWFGLICADPSSTSASSSPSPSNLPTTRRKHCASRHWYGRCKKWVWESERPKSDL